MTKSYKYDTRKRATAWQVGQRTWFDGHESVENLWVVTAVSSITRHYDDDGYLVDVTFRAASPEEFRQSRVNWLRKQVSDNLSLCCYGRQDVGRLETEARDAVARCKAEIAELEAAA